MIKNSLQGISNQLGNRLKRMKNEQEKRVPLMDHDVNLSTDQLLELLFKEHNIKSFLTGAEMDFFMPSFCEYITGLCQKHCVVPEHIIRKSDIERSYGHQLFNGRRRPSRDTAIQLAFGFELDVEQAQTLLKVARKSPLYPRVKRDSAVIYCLHNRLSIVETQIVLQDLGLPLLGGKRNERD